GRTATQDGAHDRHTRAPPRGAALLVLTDFSDEPSWRALLEEIRHADARGGPAGRGGRRRPRVPRARPRRRARAVPAPVRRPRPLLRRRHRRARLAGPPDPRRATAQPDPRRPAARAVPRARRRAVVGGEQPVG